MPKVTVAIPTYNRPEFLTECINSVLNQTFQDFRIIVFDNCSDFDIELLLKKFNDQRISLIRAEKNIGNAGNFRAIFLHEFDTPYLVVFHDDDFMHPELLGRQMMVMEADHSIAWAGTDLNFVNNFSKMAYFTNSLKQKGYKILDVANLVRELLAGFNLSFSSVMYRISILESIEPFQKRFLKWADRPYIISLAQKGKSVLFYDKLVNYRVHPDQDSHAPTEPEINIRCSKELFKFYLELLPKPLSQKDKKLFYTFSSDNILRFAVSTGGKWQGIQKIIESFQKEQLFFYKSISLKGVFYLFISLWKKYL